MARRPAALANCNAKIDTPPVPCSNTLSPGASRATSITARHAVTPAHGSVAASASLKNAGGLMTARSGSKKNS